ncbi:hypothetical protein QTV49_005252 [Vibrio vulnificus]|nr:hypothetical protein [Vibrio vulnificus]
MELKLIRHMTLDEYKESIIPLLVELKSILRKKFIFQHISYNGLSCFVTADEYMALMKSESVQYMDSNDWGEDREEERLNYREELLQEAESKANEFFLKHKIKPTNKMPEGMQERLNEICNTINPLLTLKRVFDLNKMCKDHKSEVRFAMDYDAYIEDVLLGNISFEEVEHICADVGVKAPKRVYSFASADDSCSNLKGDSPANQELFNKIKESLKPLTDEIAEIQIPKLKAAFEKYESLERKVSFITFVIENYEGTDARCLIMLSKEGWNKGLTQIKDMYLDALVSRYAYRVSSEMATVICKYGQPSLSFKKIDFNAGTVEAYIALGWDNLEITCESKVIIAGGMIQRLHYRFLTQYRLNGVLLTGEKIEGL